MVHFSKRLLLSSNTATSTTTTTTTTRFSGWTTITLLFLVCVPFQFVAPTTTTTTTNNLSESAHETHIAFSSWEANIHEEKSVVRAYNVRNLRSSGPTSLVHLVLDTALSLSSNAKNNNNRNRVLEDEQEDDVYNDYNDYNNQAQQDAYDDDVATADDDAVDNDYSGGSSSGSGVKNKVDHAMSNSPNEWDMWDWGVAGGAFLVAFIAIACVLQTILQLICCNGPEPYSRSYSRDTY